VLRTVLKRIRPYPLALAGGLIVVSLLAAALLAPVIAPFDPLAQDLYQGLEAPSFAHPMGTDEFGRDIFSRIVYGARITLRIGLICISI
ncbi:uncharacterized protein METZ01_LOCUS488519, partial [marine metagenome]